MNAQELFEKNKKFIHETTPRIAHIVDKTITPLSKVEYDDQGNVVNLSVQGVNLYGKDVDEYCEFQVQNYFEKPTQLIFPDPNHCNISNVTFGLFRHMQQFQKQHDVPEDWLSGVPINDIAFFFCFGLGLGRHIEPLLEQATCKHFVIFEPVRDFVYQSMFAVDWEAIYSKAKDMGITLHIIADLHIEEAINAIESMVQGIGVEFVEGSFFYVHYPSWENEYGVSKLKERLDTFVNSSGFFEDEMNMVTNAYKNLRATDYRLIKNKPVLQQDMPAFVVASGPSLNDTLPYVKKWRDHVVLVSCGTTLRILLKNGIRPDIHIENENVPQTYEIIKSIDSEYDLSGIVIAASTTVYPKSASFFDEVWYFNRPGLSATRIFGEPKDALVNPVPLVANAAVSVAGHLGFKNIYMFGVDCGKLQTAQTHHRDSLYHDQLGRELGSTENRLDKYYDRLVPGNFGGEVITGKFHDTSRISLSNLQKVLSLNLYNCSNGARVDRATPLSAAAVRLTTQPGKQQKVLQSIRDQLPPFKAGTVVETANLQSWKEGAIDFKDLFREYMDEVIEETDSFIDIHTGVSRFWSEYKEQVDGLYAIIVSTLLSMNRLAAYLGIRIKDDELRKSYIKFEMQKYYEIADWMADGVADVFQQMLDDKDEIEQPEIYEGGFEYHRQKAREEQAEKD